MKPDKLQPGPSHQVSASDVERRINRAERRFVWCLNVLRPLKEGRGDFSAVRFARFQGALAETLFTLQQLYSGLSAARSALVKEKSKLDPEQFLKQIRELGQSKGAVQRAIALGKAIGDAFVWPFVYREQAHLEQQAKLPATIMPIGIGGIGEVKFIQGARQYRGRLIVYNSITTLLRSGDFTLIRLETLKLSGIAELKTEEGNGLLRMNASMVLCDPELLKPGTDTHEEAAAIFEPLAAKLREKLKKQMPRMVAAVAAAGGNARVGPTISVRLNTNADLVSDLLQSLTPGASGHRSRDGVAVYGYRLPRQRLSQAVSRPGNEIFEGNNGAIAKALNENIGDGRSRYFQVHTLGQPGTTSLTTPPSSPPFFWSQLSMQVVADVLLRRVLVIVVFNPAGLLERLRAQGFMRTAGGGLKMEVGKRTFYLQGLSSLFALATELLWTEAEVADFICSLAHTAVESGRFRAAIDIRFAPHFHLW